MKRFTETTIWDEDWFLNMPKEYKLFWFYLKDKCNHTGIWRPNIMLFEATIGVKGDLKKAIDFFNSNKERIKILSSGHWYILDFFTFQYGDTFNPANRVHKSIQDIYKQEDINLTSIRGLKEVKDGVKDKDKDKDIVIDFKKNIIPYVEISDFYNSICKSLSKVQTLSEGRKNKIKCRWSEIKSIEGFKDIFKIMESTPFLKGVNPQGWKADFDWIIENDTNYVKVIEGKYDSNKSASPQPAKTVVSAPKEMKTEW